MSIRLDQSAALPRLLCGFGLVAAAAGCTGQDVSTGSTDAGQDVSTGSTDSGGGTETQSQAEASTEANPGCAVVLASNYDQSCNKDTDCVVAFEEFSCGSCDIAAINASAQSQYKADSTRGLPDFCYDALDSSSLGVCCVAGACTSWCGTEGGTEAGADGAIDASGE